MDIIDFRKQLEDYWLMEDNIVKVLGKMGDRRKRLKVEVVELMHVSRGRFGKNTTSRFYELGCRVEETCLF